MPTPRLRRLVEFELAALSSDTEMGLTAVRSARACGVSRSELEETLLQGVLFFGFPRVVNAFHVLQKAWPASESPSGGDVPQEDWPAAGRELFDSIYADNSADVRAMLHGFHEAFEGFVLESAYGRILSRPGLPPVDRELLAVAALAAMNQIPQLIAHARGALRFGAAPEDLRAVLDLSAPRGVDIERVLRRVGNRSGEAR